MFSFAQTIQRWQETMNHLRTSLTPLTYCPWQTASWILNKDITCVSQLREVCRRRESYLEDDRLVGSDDRWLLSAGIAERRPSLSGLFGRSLRVLLLTKPNCAKCLSKNRQVSTQMPQHKPKALRALSTAANYPNPSVISSLDSTANERETKWFCKTSA